MASLASPVCVMGGLRLPGLPKRSNAQRPAEQRLTLPAGHYNGSSRQVSSLAFVGSFRQQPAEPSNSPLFVRPDCPSVFESVDETDREPDLEDVDMAKLHTMKLSQNSSNSKSSSRSALEQASFMTNELLVKEEEKISKARKGRFGMLGL